MLITPRKSVLTVCSATFIFGIYSAFSATSFAADSGSISIISPKEGSSLPINQENVLEYEVKLGPQDDHFHVWVDGEKGPAQRALKGSYTLPKMAPGNHAVIVKLVDKSHVPTGPERSIFVKVE